MRKSIKGGYQTSRSSKKTTRRRRKSRSSKSVTKYVGGNQNLGKNGFKCRPSTLKSKLPCDDGLVCKRIDITDTEKYCVPPEKVHDFGREAASWPGGPIVYNPR
jgi:hypothetical protein